MKEDIIKFSKQAIDKIHEIDDLVDSTIIDYKDLLDTTEDLLKPLKALRSIYLTTQKIKFKSFLKSYSEGLHDEFENSSLIENSEKLKQYLSIDRNLNFIYECIDSSINSKSINCSAILGYFTSLILKKQITIEYKELVILNALRNLNDFELNTAYTLLNTTKKYLHIRNNKMEEYTIEKLKTMNIVEMPQNDTVVGSYGWGECQFSDITLSFIDTIKESKVNIE